MNFLRDLFRRQRPSEQPDLGWHDQRIQALELTATKLEQVKSEPPKSEPLTARVRGIYPERRVRVVRISPRNREHHAQG